MPESKERLEQKEILEKAREYLETLFATRHYDFLTLARLFDKVDTVLYFVSYMLELSIPECVTLLGNYANKTWIENYF